MKIDELIALLKQYPADLEVLVQSYEDGYDPVTDVKVMPVKEMENKFWPYGVYDEDEAGRTSLLIWSRFNREDK